MGTVYRKAYTQPLPDGAEIIERDGVRIARWKVRTARPRTAELVTRKDGTLGVRGRSAFFTAKYRDASGRIVEVSTNCRDETAARAILLQCQRQVELVKAGVLSDHECQAAGHAFAPLDKHFEAYQRHMEAKGNAPRRIQMVRARLERLARECGFSRLNKMSAGGLEEWLVRQKDAGMSAASRNGYREVAITFGNWCRRTHRLTHNPFADVPRADANVDRRHHRRALTQAELLRLLETARWRPLAEFGREIRAKEDDPERSPRSRATWDRKPLTFDDLDAAVDRAREALMDDPELITSLERTGHERALIYKMLFLTGLRKGELASLTVGQIDFGGPVAYAVLNAADEKNRQGSTIPLRADLAAELSSWLKEQLDGWQEQACRSGRPIPAQLSASAPLFHMPSGLTRIFDRDLAVAGIPKRDERNRVVDVHALRVTFGTHLCAAGVPLRTAQAAMRHSKPELTANIYTDPKLLDIAGAINALPALVPSAGAKAGVTRLGP